MSLSHSIISEIQRKIDDFRRIGIPEYHERETTILFADRVVSTLVGARRSGKSFRTFQVASELLSSGWLQSLNHICFIDFDNTHFSSISAIDLGHIRDIFLAQTQSAGIDTNLLFVFDEIHRIKGWEDFAVELSRNPRWRVLITGSSSRMLKSDIAMSLRGKSLSSEMYPLSFSEFLTFRQIEPDSSTLAQARIQAAFDEFLQWGSFPQVAQSPNAVREALLREYFDTMILKDIIQRYNVSRPQQCIALYRYLLSLMSKPYTLNSAVKYLRTMGLSATVAHISNYISWAEDSWFLFSVPIFSDSLAEVNRNYHKCYCIDWGLAIKNGQVWDGFFSRAFENLIFIHLRKKFARVQYYLTKSKRQEVDFIACDSYGKPQLAVQACLELDTPETLNREIVPLAAAAKWFGIENVCVVTKNEQRELKHDGVSIQVVPAWRWLLDF